MCHLCSHLCTLLFSLPHSYTPYEICYKYLWQTSISFFLPALHIFTFLTLILWKMNKLIDALHIIRVQAPNLALMLPFIANTEVVSQNICYFLYIL